MEMCYDGALVMPNNYAVVDEEEMTYVDGGSWASYKGKDALKQLTVIAGCATGHMFAAIQALDGAAVIAGCSGGLALVVSLGLAIGASLLIGLSVEEYLYLIGAAGYMVSSWAKNGFSNCGFRADMESIWEYTWCKGVDAL